MDITIDNQYSAAALYDGGWRSGDLLDLICEYNLTYEQAKEICKELAAIEDDAK